MESSQSSSRSWQGWLAASIVIMILAGSTIMLGILYADARYQNPNTDQLNICQTKECITAASRILNAMDTSTNPCEDFFQYSCGSWNDARVISSDQSSISTFKELRNDLSRTLKRVLEREDNTIKESVKKARSFYSSCMNTSKIDSLNSEPIMDMIKRMGGWPILGHEFNDTEFTLEQVLSKFRSDYATNSIISFWIGPDSKSSKQYIIHIDQPTLGLPTRDYYLDEDKASKVIPGYKAFMKEFIKLMDENNILNDSIIEEFTSKVVTFETELANISSSNSERRRTRYLQKLYYQYTFIRHFFI